MAANPPQTLLREAEGWSWPLPHELPDPARRLKSKPVRPALRHPS